MPNNCVNNETNKLREYFYPQHQYISIIIVGIVVAHLSSRQWLKKNKIESVYEKAEVADCLRYLHTFPGNPWNYFV